MDRESIYELQKVDCNCNDCIFMVRDLEKYKSFNELYENTTPRHRLQYGTCSKFNKSVSFIPNTIQLNTQQCFKHRKDDRATI
jgi:hypothetical protein